MAESLYSSFRETQLPAYCQRAYTLARDAHALRLTQSPNSQAPYLFHPATLAQAAIQAKLPQEAVLAALVHDLVEWTPVQYDHLHQALDGPVVDCVYDMTCPVPLANCVPSDWMDQYIQHLQGGSTMAQQLKLLDLIHTTLELGAKQPQQCVAYVAAHQTLVDAMVQWAHAKPALSTLALRAQFTFQWGSKRAYEHQVANYRASAAHA